MSKLLRFSVSLKDDLLKKFDKQIKEEKYPTRSKAIEDLIRESLVKKEFLIGNNIAGTITLVYDHHKRDLITKLTDIQHDFHNIIISSQHIHLDHDNCLEIIVIKGKAHLLENLFKNLKSVKGIKHSSLTTTTTGK